MEKPGSSAHFPKRTGCMQWFFRMSAGTKLIAPVIIAASRVKRKFLWKMEILNFSRATFPREEIFAISIINAPNWQRSAGNGNLRVMHRFQVQRRL